MTVLRVSGFGGIIPRLGKRLLPDNNAQYALNSQLFSGELRSWRQPKLLATFSFAPADVYHYRHKGETIDHYIPFTVKTDVVKAPIINDSFGRLYWTNGTGMYTTTMSDVEANIPPTLTGVPAPVFGTKPTVTAAGGTVALAETRVYLFILVSKYGEEGPPSNDSTITVAGNNDGTWTVANLNTIVNPGGTVTKLRMYRTITTAGNVTYRQVVEWPIGAVPASFVDNIAATVIAVAPQLESLSWIAPPLGMTGLCAGPNGMLAAFTGRTIRFSVPFFPHAWPDAQQLAVEDDIVAMGWVGTMLVVGTTGRPAFVVGSQPTALTLQKFGDVLPCLSARSLVATSTAVFYASLDGLLSISTDGVNNVSNTFCSRQDWLARFPPANISGAIYQSRYFGFYSSQLGFSLGFDDATTGMTDLQYDGVTTMKNSAVDNSAHIIVGNKLMQWDESAAGPLLYVWRTKPFLTPKPCNFGIIQVRGDFPGTGSSGVTPPVTIDPRGHSIDDKEINDDTINGAGVQPASLASDTVGIKLYGDKKLRWVGAIGSESPVRLPAGYKSVEWEIEVSGNISVFSVVIAGTGTELEQVP